MRPSPTPTRPAKSRILKSLKPRLIRGATAGLIATVILGTTGCKSSPFTLPKPTLPTLAKPDLSKLAFWKSENLMAKKGNVPKPPSLSFDSSPIKQAVASSKGSTAAEIASLRSQIASTKSELTEPIREPYKYAAKSAAGKLAKGANLDLSSGSSSRNSLPKSDLGDSKITQAQRDFQAALASSSKAINKSAGGKIADLKATGNDFAMQRAIKAGKTNVDDSLMAVNKSLYNAQGKLGSAADNAIKGAATDNQLSMFEKRLKMGTEKAKAVPAQVASSGSSTKSASNAFGGVAPPKPLPSPTLPAKNLFAGNNGSNLLNAASNTSPTAAVSSEVAELKAQLAQLRSDQQKLVQQQQQLAASQPRISAQPPASVKPTNTTPIARQSDPREFVANLTARPAPSYPQMYPSSAPLRTANSSNNVSSNAPQNVLRGNFSPVASNATQYPSNSTDSVPLTAPQPTAYPDSKYPSTPHNSYGAPVNNYSASAAPTYAASTRDAQASFQQNGNSNLVITASTPVEPAQRHVSEVNIPNAVLQGTSSYAPGTVHALR